eukprot:TRINITY_DN1250_c1_g1_i10.p2 TRINITY_DN1250_c1_g1~~TRINITY_DN1250_c1_g1_i10.p2  ORF type:complete len:180 (+),score=37.81 TRINITY_DN1250_c1_g1_i10:206-745(+)
MGNCHVFLRFYDPKTDEPYYSKIELGEHIKWAEMQQHAFNEFKPYYASGLDPSNIHFTTVLDSSNREMAIDDGDTLRSMFEQFVKQEKGGNLAVLDVVVKQPGYEHHKIGDKGVSKKAMLKEFKMNMQHKKEKHGHKEVSEVIVEEEWEKYYEKNQGRITNENKTVIFMEFEEQVNKRG